MNAAMALEWCLAHQEGYPNDKRTAIHVADWLADKALIVCATDAQVVAVNAAKDWALRVISK